MSVSFSRTTAALRAERANLSPALLLLAAVFACGWLAWFLLARVGVTVVSEEARVEVAGASAPVALRIGGTVVGSELEMGAEVRAGQILVTLDSTVDQRFLEEETARGAAIGATLDGLRRSLQTGDRLLGTTRRGAAVAVEEANARWVEADAAAQAAEERLTRLESVPAGRGFSEIDLVQARALARQLRAAADALQADVRGEGLGQDLAYDDRLSRVQAIEQEITRLTGDSEASASAVARLEERVSWHTLRAPVEGSLGEVAVLRPGAVLEAGDVVASVIPVGQLRVVAVFAPGASLGRIRAGQAARVRLQGFPWTQYGAVSAVVTRVAGEARDQRVRVELDLLPEDPPRIPLRHGMPGQVEVELELASPAALALRAAGGVLSPGAGP